MRNKRPDEEIYDFHNPSLEICKDIPFGNQQVLILCDGFEDRAKFIVQKLLEKEALLDDFIVIFIKYLPEIKSNDTWEIIASLSKRIKVKTLVYDRHNPKLIEDKILHKIPGKSKRIWIDISGMSRLLIVQLLSAFVRKNDLLSKSAILYTEAKDYPPQREEAEEKLNKQENSGACDFSFLSTGVFKVQAVPELATVSIGDAPTLLIAFPSFNPAQLSSIFENNPPSKTLLIHGEPPSKQLKWRQDIIAKMNQLPEESFVDEKIVCTLDYDKTLKLLVKEYQDHAPFYNIVISPTGSKMQTVAAGIFKGFFKDIQVVYPTHRDFNDTTSYTKEVGNVHLLSLADFGVLSSQLKKNFVGF
jgi:hypothetical protein